jgi:hypothetical protein
MLIMGGVLVASLANMAFCRSRLDVCACTVSCTAYGWPVCRMMREDFWCLECALRTGHEESIE